MSGWGQITQVHDLGLLVRHCQSEFLTCDSYNVHHPGKLTRWCRRPPHIVFIKHPSHRSPNHVQRPLLPGSVILTLRRIIEVHQVRNDQQVFHEPLQNHYDDRCKEDNEQQRRQHTSLPEPLANIESRREISIIQLYASLHTTSISINQRTTTSYYYISLNTTLLHI